MAYYTYFTYVNPDIWDTIFQEIGTDVVLYFVCGALVQADLSISIQVDTLSNVSEITRLNMGEWNHTN